MKEYAILMGILIGASLIGFQIDSSHKEKMRELEIQAKRDSINDLRKQKYDFQLDSLYQVLNSR